jgi:L-aminopeptidase/D-esterase-like protein
VATLAPGALTDVAGLAVGHAAVAGRPSGCTVVLCPQGVVAGVDVRGGAPGTRETDLLRPGNLVQQVHAVLLTGGSAFGLDAAAGVMRWLEARGHGFAVGAARVPIVPAAVIFDLGLGPGSDDPQRRPGAATGFAACEAAAATPPPQGNAGAGLGATVGKLWGPGRAMKGGLGTASLRAGGVTVAALVVVNAAGDVLDAQGRVLAGARTADGRARLGTTQALAAGAWPPGLQPARAAPSGPAASAAALPGQATTIGVVATDAVLAQVQASRLATLAHHGLSRRISPVLQTDGDTLFALATGGSGLHADLGLLGALAAEAVSLAIANAAQAARSLVLPDGTLLPAACDLGPATDHAG